MHRIAVFLTAVLMSSALWASQCPQDMAKIDAMLESNPPDDPAVLAQVKELRAQGEEQHKSGNHSQSMQTLEEAMQLLDASE